MIKSASLVETDNGGLLKSNKGEAFSFRHLLDHFTSQVQFAEAALISSLPRGGLQIVQPAKLPEQLVRIYNKDLHFHDRLTWRAIADEKPIRDTNAWPSGQFESSRYRQDFLLASGFAHAACAPLKAPLLDGYPGAIQLFRSASQGDFTDEELRRLGQFASEVDRAIEQSRDTRKTSSEDKRVSHTAPVRQFIFNQKLESPVPQADPNLLDEKLRQNVLQSAQHHLSEMNGDAGTGDRVPLADSHGDLWNFRVVAHRNYPALSDGAVVFFCLQPTCGDWTQLRPSDFQADGEVSRLIPAIKFMREHYHRGPTLIEIAKTVHLSPFHFHRRFTELLGITPKHFLLDCQIAQAKKDLLADEKDLVKIAAECGFAHQSHFTSRFKQATGLTPTRWRKMMMQTRKN